jgi:hypothetical protein
VSCSAALQHRAEAGRARGPRGKESRRGLVRTEARTGGPQRAPRLQKQSSHRGDYSPPPEPASAPRRSGPPPSTAGAQTSLLRRRGGAAGPSRAEPHSGEEDSAGLPREQEEEEGEESGSGSYRRKGREANERKGREGSSRLAVSRAVENPATRVRACACPRDPSLFADVKKTSQPHWIPLRSATAGPAARPASLTRRSHVECGPEDEGDATRRVRYSLAALRLAFVWCVCAAFLSRRVTGLGCGLASAVSVVVNGDGRRHVHHPRLVLSLAVPPADAHSGHSYCTPTLSTPLCSVLVEIRA